VPAAWGRPVLHSAGAGELPGEAAVWLVGQDPT
jgi:hypothetical protein